MSTPLSFFVAGLPVTQGSKSAIRVGDRAIVVEGKSDKARGNFTAWRHAIATEARRAAGNGWPTAQAVIVTLEFRLQRPASAPKRRRTWPIGARSGDVDKLARAALDAITGVLVADDAQVVGLSVTKRYGSPTGCAVGIWVEEEHRLWLPDWVPCLHEVA